MATSGSIVSGTATTEGKQYHADIDGLRGVAILSVIGFHLFPQYLTGGFIGVDVFFIISGYLISGILFRKLDQDRLLLTDFYARRVRRIFPALVLVLFSALVFGWLNLFPQELKRLSSNICAGALFGSNFFDLMQGGYFDPVEKYNSMLHLWSLGIEEQYYLVWPLLLLLFYRRRFFPFVMALLLAASFALDASLAARHSPAGFYLPFARFWELVAGGMLAYLSKKNGRESRLQLHRFSDLGSLLGLMCILLPLLLFDERIAFPGWWAVIPVLGACILIWSGKNAWVNRVLLAHPMLVWIGLISYPLYLWHWPLLSLGRYVTSGTEFSFLMKASLILLSFALSSFTYYFIEKKIRTKGPGAALILCSLVGAIAVASFLFWFTDGASARFKGRPENSAGLYAISKGLSTKGECLLSEPAKELATFCESDNRTSPNLLLWGDSHADALYPGLLAKALPSQGWTIIGRPGCLPLLGIDEEDASCAELSRKVMQEVIQTGKVQAVALVFAARMVNDLKSDTLEKAMTTTIQAISPTGKGVIVLISVPRILDEDRFFNSFCFERPFQIDLVPKESYCSVPRNEYEQYVRIPKIITMRLKRRFPDMQVFDPEDLLCEEGNCNVLKDGHSLYSYTDHLSDYGSSIVGESIDELSLKLLRP